MSTIGTRLQRAMRGQGVAAFSLQHGFAARHIKQVLDGKQPSFSTARSLASLCGAGWLWMLDGVEADEKSPPPTLEEDVRYRFYLVLLALKPDGSFEQRGNDLYICFNFIERLALARAIDRSIGVRCFPGWEDLERSVREYVSHIMLFLDGPVATGHWRAAYESGQMESIGPFAPVDVGSRRQRLPYSGDA